MMTSLAFHITALATATAWRWPPERVPTGWRIDRTVVTDRLARVCWRRLLHLVLVEQPVAEPLPPEKHVLDDVEVVGESEVLVDGRDAEGGSVLRALRIRTGWPSHLT